MLVLISLASLPLFSVHAQACYIDLLSTHEVNQNRPPPLDMYLRTQNGADRKHSHSQGFMVERILTHYVETHLKIRELDGSGPRKHSSDAQAIRHVLLL